MLGFDYGTKPTVGVLGDVEFPHLLRRGLIGLGYGLVPQFGLLVNPPFLAMVFEDAEIARDCFAHFRGWCEDPGDADALGIAFIEYDSGEYGLSVYQEPRLLSERLIPEPERSEFELVTMITPHLKLFGAVSQAYSWFKSAVKDRLFVLAPATSEGELILDLGLRKKQVDFFNHHDIPEHSVVQVFADLDQHARESGPRPVPVEAKLAPEEIASRRASQLSRFFPVTLERLEFEPAFTRAKAVLVSNGYREWQVLQAACNVGLRHRSPELFRPAQSAADPGQVQLLRYLVHDVELVSMPQLHKSASSPTALRRQIHADMRNLLTYVGVTDSDRSRLSRQQLQRELERRGLLHPKQHT